eukprot:scaffold58943_cov31-Tisochrysis_lutea.AAC.3
MGDGGKWVHASVDTSAVVPARRSRVVQFASASWKGASHPPVVFSRYIFILPFQSWFETPPAQTRAHLRD